jgi:hypothetical protein
LTEADFLLQLPAYLEHEALQLWRKCRKNILIKPEGASDRDWDPIADVIALFKEHFGVASAAKVRELQTLKKRKDETCRMLRSRLECLAEETGLLNARGQAMTFVNALPPALRERIEPIMWARSPSGIYSLDDAAGIRGWQSLDNLVLGTHLLMPPARQTPLLVAGADTPATRPTGAEAQTAAARLAASAATLRPSVGLRRARSSSPTGRARVRAAAARSVGSLSGWMRWQLKSKS